jgi:hypothetical protein
MLVFPRYGHAGPYRAQPTSRRLPPPGEGRRYSNRWEISTEIELEC